MGFWNPRAICPSCGGKIHTQAGRTGHTCQHCGAPLTGRRGFFTNRGEVLQPPSDEAVEKAPGERRDVVLTALPDGDGRKLKRLVKRWTSEELTAPMVVSSDILLEHAEGLQKALEKRGATVKLREPE